MSDQTEDLEPVVHVVDDEPDVRDALSLFLESSGYTVRCHESAQDFLNDYRPEDPGCLILDLRMPGMDGLALQQELARRQIEIPVIFLSAHGDVPMASRAFKAGAVDFLEKPFNDEVLLSRVREALERDRRSRDRMVWEAAIRERFSRLTPREQEVMARVVQGMSNKEIARALGVSHRTIDVHRARVMEKMGARTLPELVTMGVLCGFKPMG